MLAQLREQADEFARRSAEVIIVECNDAYRIRYLQRRERDDRGRERPIDIFLPGAPMWMGESGGAPWPVVTDPAGTVGASYGIAFSQKESAGLYCNRPATFLIDLDGIIRFAHHYLDVDPVEIEELLQVLDDLEEKRRLIAALEESDPRLGEAARRALEPAGGGGDGGPGGAAAAVEILAAALDGGDDDRRAAAAAALWRFGERAAPAVPALARSLGHPAERVRRLSAEALSRIGPAAASAAPALIEATLRADSRVHDVFSHLLGIRRPEARAALPRFAEAAAAEIRVRAAAIAALARFGAEAVPAILEALDSRDPAFRSIAADLLRRLPAEAGRTSPALARLLEKDPDARVRRDAAIALKGLRYEPALLGALRDPDPDVRAAAAYALERTGGLLRWDALQELVRALDDEIPRVRDAAYYAISHRSDDSVPTLIARLAGGDPGTRLGAVRIFIRLVGHPVLSRDLQREEVEGRLRAAIGDIGAAALRQALDDADPRVREAAAAALDRLGIAAR